MLVTHGGEQSFLLPCRSLWTTRQCLQCVRVVGGTTVVCLFVSLNLCVCVRVSCANYITQIADEEVEVAPRGRYMLKVVCSEACFVE